MSGSEQELVPFLIPLKLKYLTRHPSRAGTYRPRTGNSHGPKRHSVLWFLHRVMKKRGGK